MKHIKLFESWFNKKRSVLKFKKDDYVIAIDLDIKDVLLKNYLENNVGQIISIDNDTFDVNFCYEVYYENMEESDTFYHNEKNLRLATPEEIDTQKQINKFNI